MNKKTLVLCTNAFPYGKKNETYLETEIHHLCRAFAKVYILPSKKMNTQRVLPENAQVVDGLPPITVRNKWRSLMRYSLPVLSIYGFSLFRKGNFYTYLRHSKMYVDLTLQALQRREYLKKWIEEENLSDALFYDYWFENATLALAILKKQGHLQTVVSRVHNFDLYDIRWGSAKVPFREYKAKYLKRIFPISEHGLQYLLEKIPFASEKVELSYLGVKKAPADLAQRVEKLEVPLLVSCSSIIDIKRVERIPEVLKHIPFPLKWVHFGSGPMEAEVREAVKKIPSHITYELKGQASNEEVLAYYRTYHVDLFVSLSTREGLPVSMMEAISYGIPILACGVYGIPEIVTETTGSLVGTDEPSEKIAEKIIQLLNKPLNRSIVQDFFHARFEENRNYKKLIDQLKPLS